jgi:hypothetical protein
MSHQAFHFVADYLWAIVTVSLWFPAAWFHDLRAFWCK